MVVSGKLPTHLSPNLTLTLTSIFEQTVKLGRGRWAVSPEKTIDTLTAVIVVSKANTKNFDLLWDIL